MDAVTHRTGGFLGRRRSNCIGRCPQVKDASSDQRVSRGAWPVVVSRRRWL